MTVPETPPATSELGGGVLVLANNTQLAFPAKSSARNTIETVFCLRRNHISASALNGTSQRMTNGRGAKKEAAMKRCAQCHGKLGLGLRSRNLWNGRWWIQVRYCSTHCEALHLERRQRQTPLVHTFLSGSSQPS